MDSTLPVKVLDCFLYFAPRKLLDDLFQFRDFLAHDLFELYRFHTGVLELREGPSGLDRFMLPPVADKQNAVIRMEPVQKVMHLSGRCQRDSSSTYRRFSPVSGSCPRARCFCNVDVSMPASASFCAARDVGAKPSTRYPSFSAPSRITARVVVFPHLVLPIFSRLRNNPVCLMAILHGQFAMPL